MTDVTCVICGKKINPEDNYDVISFDAIKEPLEINRQKFFCRNCSVCLARYYINEFH